MKKFNSFFFDIFLSVESHNYHDFGNTLYIYLPRLPTAGNIVENVDSLALGYKVINCCVVSLFAAKT